MYKHDIDFFSEFDLDLIWIWPEIQYTGFYINSPFTFKIIM